MAYFVQLDGNLVTAHLEAIAAPTVLPVGRTFREVATFADAPMLSTLQGDVFTPPPPVPPVAIVTNADLLAEIKKLKP